MIYHESVPCPRCRAVPQHIDVSPPTDTGAHYVKAACQDCAINYVYKLIPDSTLPPLLCDCSDLHIRPRWREAPTWFGRKIK